MWPKKLTVIAAIVVLPLLLAACGGGDDDDDGKPGEIQSAHGLSVRAAAGVGERLLDAATADEEQTGGDSAAPPAEGAGFDTRDVSVVAQQQGPNGITVTGYGVASVEADSAFLELYFGGYAVPVPGTGADSGGVEYRSEASIAEADLQPVIDALVDAGVAREDIELLGGTYYDYYSSNATLRVTVRNIDDLENLVAVAAEASAELVDIYLQGTYVSYTVADCAALAEAALTEAVADARERGAALAGALGVTLGEVVAATDYGWSPFGGTACGDGYASPVPMGGVAFAESQPRQVEFYASISVTFAMS
jgi:uncharacterized protein YggE